MTPERLPEDLDSERALISTLAAPGALDPGSSFASAHQAVLSIQPQHLVGWNHRCVLEAIQELYSDAQEINPLTLKAVLERKGNLDRIGGYPGLIEILGAEEVGKPTVLVDRLVDLWRARQVAKIGGEAIKLATSHEDPIQDVISALAGQLSALSAGRDSAKITRASDLIDRVQAREAFRDPGDGGGKAAWTGLVDLDYAIEASPRHVVIIAARPGIGKSALAVQGLWHTSRHGKPCLLISLEMDKYEVESRLASWASGEGHRQFRSGTYSDEAIGILSREQQVLDRIHIWPHASNVPWPQVEAVIRDAVRVHTVKSVWIDHVLLLAKPTLGRGANDAACWTALSRSIKRLAQELGICIVSLCQLNRAGDEVEPKLSDLKESGGWEEDANAVLMLWPKESKAQEEMPEARDVYVKVAKNRSGQGFFKRLLEFRGATNRFAVIERTNDESSKRAGRRM